MTSSRCHVFILWLVLVPNVLLAAEADHSQPVPVPDEFDLGERLALIDWLRERRISIPENPDLPVLRRLYLTAVDATKSVHPDAQQRKEAADQLRLNLWRRFSVNADSSASLENLQRQFAELQARQQASDERTRKASQQDIPAEQERSAQKSPAPEPFPPPEKAIVEAPRAPEVERPRDKVDPIDRLFVEHSQEKFPLTFRDFHLLDSVLHFMEQGRFPTGGVWTPPDLERWAKLSPIIERLFASWEKNAGIADKVRQLTLRGPDPAGARSVTMRRQIIERSVLSLAEPVAVAPSDSIMRPQNDRWYLMHRALGLEHASGTFPQHWLQVNDRHWAKRWIPDLLTALERDLVLPDSAVDQEILVTIASWCAAMAPVEQASQFLNLAPKIKYPTTRLRFLSACSGPAATGVRLQTLAAIDDQSLEHIQSVARFLRDPQVVDALVQRLILKPKALNHWNRPLASLPISKAVCARMIDLGLQAVPTLNGTSPNPQAMWLMMAIQSLAVRGCLSVAQRATLENACKNATGPATVLVTTARICEEPDAQRRVDLLCQWLKTLAATPSADDRLRDRLVPVLIKGLYLERARPADEVLSLLKATLQRDYQHDGYITSILARHGAGPKAPTGIRTTPTSLSEHLSSAFDPVESPKQIEAYLLAGKRIPEHDVMAIVRALPAGAGAKWAPAVMRTLETWWSAPTPDDLPHDASTALSIGVWVASCGSIEWAMIWARRTDELALRTNRGNGDQFPGGSLIIAVANPEHERAQIWREEQQRIASPQLPLITWLMDRRPRRLPADITVLPEAWPQVLELFIPKGRAGEEVITPLLDVRTAFDFSGEGGALMFFVTTRLDP